MRLLRFIAWVFLKLLIALLKAMLYPFEYFFALDFEKRHPRIVAVGNWIIGKVLFIEQVIDMLMTPFR